jgi:putative ABC transport system ATP-binding protein
VNLQRDEGSIGVILGPSDSGKSTLMNIIGGVDRADNRKVLVNRIEVSSLKDDKLTDYRRDSNCFVFQYYNLIPNLNVWENVVIVSNINKNPLDIDKALAAVSLASMKNRFTRELFGGEQ